MQNNNIISNNIFIDETDAFFKYICNLLKNNSTLEEYVWFIPFCFDERLLRKLCQRNDIIFRHDATNEIMTDIMYFKKKTKKLVLEGE